MDNRKIISISLTGKQKEFLQEKAAKEQRTLSNYIVYSVMEMENREQSRQAEMELLKQKIDVLERENSLLKQGIDLPVASRRQTEKEGTGTKQFETAEPPTDF